MVLSTFFQSLISCLLCTQSFGTALDDRCVNLKIGGRCTARSLYGGWACSSLTDAIEHDSASTRLKHMPSCLLFVCTYSEVYQARKLSPKDSPQIEWYYPEHQIPERMRPHLAL